MNAERTSAANVWTGDAMQHLVCACGVAARHRDAGTPVALEQTIEVRRGLARDVAAAAEQLDVADAVRGQIPTDSQTNITHHQSLHEHKCASPIGLHHLNALFNIAGKPTDQSQRQ